MVWGCESCTRGFATEHAAVQHMNALDHWKPLFECETCQEGFDLESDLDEHLDDTGHDQPQVECETCGAGFYFESALDAHLNATGHDQPQFECETCVLDFFTQEAADRHMADMGHWQPRFECDTCNRRFHSKVAAEQHMDALSHHKTYDCHDCCRTFQNENALKMHLNSEVHRGKSIACPFCKVNMTTASGLSHHLETGSCPRATNVNHRTIFQAISQRDPGRVLTKKLLTYPDSPSGNTATIATNATWNGFCFECYLCHRNYGSLQALNQHLNSPAHSQKLYHCPNRSCNREFGRLAALFNHLESESCNYVRFEKVQSSVHNFIVGRQKLVGF